VDPPNTGNQGWLAPSFTQPQFNTDDHNQYYQVNIPQIDNPFIQEDLTARRGKQAGNQ